MGASKPRKIEIMDTTLRDGEQTSGVSFSVSEKLTLAKLLLEELKVDRIEIASARVSKGEFDAVKRITAWANEVGLLSQVEILTFVDKGTSIKWMQEAGAKVQNLLTKGSLNHLTYQLKQTPEDSILRILLREHCTRRVRGEFQPNVYLEDWSNGMRNSPAYVFAFLDFSLYPKGISQGLIARYPGRFDRQSETAQLPAQRLLRATRSFILISMVTTIMI